MRSQKTVAPYFMQTALVWIMPNPRAPFCHRGREQPVGSFKLKLNSETKKKQKSLKYTVLLRTFL